MQDRVAKPISRRSPHNSGLNLAQSANAKRVVLAHPHQNAACFFNGGVEPHLSDMLNDPIIALVMHRDRVSADDILSVMRAAAKAV